MSNIQTTRGILSNIQFAVFSIYTVSNIYVIYDKLLSQTPATNDFSSCYIIENGILP